MVQEGGNSKLVGSLNIKMPEGGVWLTLIGSVPMQYYTTPVVRFVKSDNLDHLVRIKFEITWAEQDHVTV
jgi:hypothetical protein